MNGNGQSNDSLDAIQESILKDRGSKYGSIVDIAHVEQSLMRSLYEVVVQREHTDTENCLIHMIVHKIARIVCGTQKAAIDSADDMVNYSKLLAAAVRIFPGEGQHQPEMDMLRAGIAGLVGQEEIQPISATSQRVSDAQVNNLASGEVIEASPGYAPSFSTPALWQDVLTLMRDFMMHKQIPMGVTKEFENVYTSGVIEELFEYIEAVDEEEKLDAVIDAMLFLAQYELTTGRHRTVWVGTLCRLLDASTARPIEAIKAVFAANYEKTVGPVAKRGDFPYDLQKPTGWQAPDLSGFLR